MSLGIAMIAQNEELHVPASIAQFYHLADEVVLVNGGSSDNTSAWAIRMGAQVFDRPFDKDFSAQKNFAISKLDTDWIYLHDLDERLEPPLLDIMPYLMTKEGQDILANIDVLPGNEELFDCFGIARKNFINGEMTDVYPDYQYRLFKKGCFYEGKVHEKIAGFKNRTEVDFRRPDVQLKEALENGAAKKVETERGLVYEGFNLLDPGNMARFNILHYKSSKTQEKQDKLYRDIKGEI